MTVTLVLGTRPEVVKLAPVARELRRRGVPTRVLLTGQHREMARDLCVPLELQPDDDLSLMQTAQGLNDLGARLLGGVGRYLAQHPTEVVLTQGDTSTALLGSLAAFHLGVPVAHVEAGLRSGNARNPFPEEMNRRLVTRIATWHFAPTERARRNLVAEGVDPGSIEVTGNTVIDNLVWCRARGLGHSAFAGTNGGRKVLVTMHRRENLGTPMARLADAIGRLSEEENASVVFPVHLNPAVRRVVEPALSQSPSVQLTEPLDYFDFTATLEDSDIVLTDSGGVQEEAPALGKPVLVLRTTTERPELIEAGAGRLIGVEPAALRSEVRRLFADQHAYRAMADAENPFGDGFAAERIVSRLLKDLGS